MWSLKMLLYLVLFLPLVNADTFNHFKHLHRQRNFLIQKNPNDTSLQEQWFEQKLDHFDENSNETWKQRYWQNDNFTKNDTELNFLWIGGEAEEDPKYIQSKYLPIVQWAEKLGARLWDVEHRFYGKSHPTNDTSVENLKYLSGRQALEDLANFIKTKNNELKFKNPKWIVFGCSYPRSLALWMRQKFPDLVLGAVSASGPIKLTVDFYGYIEHMEKVYRLHDPKCADSVKEIFQEIDDLMDSLEGREKLDTLLKITPPLANQSKIEDLQIQKLFNDLTFMLTTQYSSTVSVEKRCNNLTEKGVDPIQRFLNSRVYQKDLSIDYKKYVDKHKKLDFESDREWPWQTCTDIGLFQSSGYNGVFGVNLPVNYYYNFCADVFGKEFNVDYIRNKIRESVEYYGEMEAYNATNVVIGNGDLDPWSVLSVTKANNPSIVALNINGTAHCKFLLSSNDSIDPENLKEAREIAFKTIQKWLSRENTNNSLESSENMEESKHDKISVEVRKALDFNSEICWNCELPKIQKPSEPSKLGYFFPCFHRLDNPLKISNQKSDLKENWIEQPFDHFDEKEKRAFKQRFFFNDKYYKKGGPIFLYIENEESADLSHITDENLPLLKRAKKFGAMIYLLEHRYYGDSVVVNAPKTAKDYYYLTSEQALADLAIFIRKINKEKKHKNPKWISFGRSYGGSLSAWFRHKYRDDVFASVGSSGPFEAIVDYYGYFQVTEKDLDLKVPNCSKAVGNAFSAVQQLFLSEEGRDVLNEKFRPQPPFKGPSVDPYDVMNFYLNKMIYRFDAQHSINEIHENCQKLVDSEEKDPIDAFIGAFYSSNGNLRDSFDLVNNSLNSVDVKNESNRSVGYWEDSWDWQTCNEFGWFFSTDFGYNAFGNSVPINNDLKRCPDLFDSSFTRDKIEENVWKTNHIYGGAYKFNASRHVEIYGSGDPWSAAGLVLSEENIKNDVTKIVINGTTHCEDFQNPKTGSNPEAIQKAVDQVTKTQFKTKNVQFIRSAQSFKPFKTPRKTKTLQISVKFSVTLQILSQAKTFQFSSRKSALRKKTFLRQPNSKHCTQFDPNPRLQPVQKLKSVHFEEYRQIISKLELKILALEKENNEIKGKNKRYEISHIEFKKSNDKYENANKILYHEKEKFQEENQKLLVDNKNLKNDMAKVQKENEKLQKNVQKIQVKNQILEKQIVDLGEKDTKLRDENSKLHANFGRIVNEIYGLKEENGKFKELQKENEELKAESKKSHDNFVSEIANLNQSLKKDMEIASLNQKLQKIKAAKKPVENMFNKSFDKIQHFFEKAEPLLIEISSSSESKDDDSEISISSNISKSSSSEYTDDDISDED